MSKQHLPNRNVREKVAKCTASACKTTGYKPATCKTTGYNYMQVEQSTRHGVKGSSAQCRQCQAQPARPSQQHATQQGTRQRGGPECMLDGIHCQGDVSAWGLLLPWLALWSHSAPSHCATFLSSQLPFFTEPEAHANIIS